MHVSIRHCAHLCPVITITGAMRVDDHAALRHLVDAAVNAAPQVLLLDLHDVTAFDSSGIVELNHARKQVERGGGRVVLISPSEPVTVVLQRTRLNAVFPHVTRAHAAAECCSAVGG